MDGVLQVSRGMQRLFIAVFLFLIAANVNAQVGTDSILREVTLPGAVDYALKHQPQIRQSMIDEQIAEDRIRGRLAEWYPQLNFNYNYQHNFILQKSLIGGNLVRLGQYNTSSLQFTGSQYIFNRDLLLANRTKNDVRLQAKQSTTSDKIDLVVN